MLGFLGFVTEGSSSKIFNYKKLFDCRDYGKAHRIDLQKAASNSRLVFAKHLFECGRYASPS